MQQQQQRPATLPLTALTPLLTPTTRLNRTQILWLVVMQAIGSAILCAAINFGIHVGVYSNSDPIHLFAFPNTIAGDMAVTLFVQSILTWVIGGTLAFGDLWRKWIPPLQPPRGRCFGRSTKTHVVLVKVPEDTMLHQWPVKGTKAAAGSSGSGGRTRQSRYASPSSAEAGTASTTAPAGITTASSPSSSSTNDDRNAVYRRPNSNQQLLDPSNSVVVSKLGFVHKLASWFVATPDPIHAPRLYEEKVGSPRAQVRAVRLIEDTEPVPVKETTTGARQASSANNASTGAHAGPSPNNAGATAGPGSSAPRSLNEQQRLLRPGVTSYQAIPLPPPSFDQQATIASQAAVAGDDKSKGAAMTTTTSLPPPAESKAAASVPPPSTGPAANTTTTSTGPTATSQNKKAAKQARKQDRLRQDQDLTTPLRGGMRVKAVFQSLLGLALRGLLCGVVFFPVFWSIGIGITAAIWGNDEGNDDNVYTRNRFPLPPLILAVYGGVLGLLQTPVLAMTVLWRGSRYAFPPAIAGGGGSGATPIGGISSGSASAAIVPVPAAATSSAFVGGGAEAASIQVVQQQQQQQSATAQVPSAVVAVSS